MISAAAPADTVTDREHQAPPRRSLFVTLGAAIGIGLLVWLVADLGPANIIEQLEGLGAILPVVLALTFLKYPLQTAGWRLALPPDARPGWVESIVATITGDTLGYLTWAGPFTGEPMRAMLIQDRVGVAAGIAAGAIERTLYNGTAAILVWLVFVFVLAHDRPWVAAAICAATALTVWGIVHRLRQEAPPQGSQPGSPGSEGAAPGRETDGRGAGAWRAVRAVVRAVHQLWRERRVVLPSIAALCVAQHAVLIGEAYLMLGTLDGRATIKTALVFEAVTKIVNTVGVIVPGRLGIAEGGSALLSGALGFTASHGLSLALMRRARAVIWAAVGLVLLPFQEARVRRSA